MEDEQALASRPGKTNQDYYFENGLLVMTEDFHLRRGYCCGNRCRHCPYDFANVDPEAKE